MKTKTVVTAENINSIISNHRKEIENLKLEFKKIRDFELSAIRGGIQILGFEYQKELSDLLEKNEKLKSENEKMKEKNDVLEQKLDDFLTQLRIA